MKDPVILYSVIDCLILPSHAEGLRKVILEASALAVPVIATRVLGCVDAVMNEKTGLFIEPSNSDALCRTMKRVFDNSQEKLAWGKNGRRFCEKYYRQYLVWQSYAKFFTDI